MKKVVRILLIAAMLVGLFAVRSVSAQEAVTGKKMALVVKSKVLAAMTALEQAQRDRKSVV